MFSITNLVCKLCHKFSRITLFRVLENQEILEKFQIYSTFGEPAKSHTLRAHLPACPARPTGPRTNAPRALKCPRTNVPRGLAHPHANLPCVPTCSSAITSNNKNKISMTYLPRVLVLFLLYFSCEIKLYMKNAIQVETQQTLVGLEDMS